MTIKREGATAFFWLSSFAKEYGLIDEYEIEARLNWLREMMAVGDDIEELNSHGLPRDSMEEINLQRDAKGNRGTTAEGCFPRKRRGSSWLPFVARGSLSGWNFHQGDPDYRPSVPHGHFRGQRYPKLDPYTGWVWTNEREKHNRVSKHDTAGLWNDLKFRRFAYRAIAWYMSEFPNYNWRVKQPLRLPGKK